MINVATAVNSKYVKYLYVMLYSLFTNNASGHVNIYILQSDLNTADKNLLTALAEKFKNKIEYINIHSSLFSSLLPVNDKWPIEIYYRLMMPEILDDVKRVIYLDVDIIVTKSLESLYSIDLEGKLVAACKDITSARISEELVNIYPNIQADLYFNSGVMLWDLYKIRTRYRFDNFISAAEKLNYRLACPDQDILNYIFYGEVKYLNPFEYNYIPHADINNYLSGDTDVNSSIIHYAFRNPWSSGAKTRLIQRWWSYAEKTPFYVELLEEQLERMEADAFTRVYEEQKNSDLRLFFELAYNLKGCNRLQKTFSGFALCIYGAGFVAEKLYNLMSVENVWDRVEIVMDQTRKGCFYGKKVVDDFGWCKPEKKYLLVVTPTYRTEELIQDLKKNSPPNVMIMSAVNYLKNIWEG